MLVCGILSHMSNKSESAFPSQKWDEEITKMRDHKHSMILSLYTMLDLLLLKV